MAADLERLPPLGIVANQIIAQLSDEFVGLPDLVAVIEQDPAISGRLISLANSAMYQLPNPVVSLSDAVIKVLGLDLTRAVSLGIAFSAFLGNACCSPKNQRLIWLDSMLMANCTRMLTLEMPQHENLSGIAHTGALLSNLGLLALSYSFPDRVDDCFDTLLVDACDEDSDDTGATEEDAAPQQKVRAQPLDNAFQEAFRIDHRQLAQQVVERWSLPAELALIVRLEPSQSNAPYAALAGYARLIRQLLDRHFAGEPLLDATLLDPLDARLQTALSEVAKRFSDIALKSEQAAEAISSAG